MALHLKHRLLAAGCAALVVATWWLAWQAPGRHAAWLHGWPGWATLAFAALAWLQGIAADPDQAPTRRLQVGLALLLLASLLFSPALAATPRPGGSPVRDALVQAVGTGATPWWLSPFAGASLLLLWRHPRMPAALSWLCGLAAPCCLMPLPLVLAPWLRSVAPGMPIAAWSLLGVVVALCARGRGRYVGLVLLLGSAAMLLHAGLQALGPLPASPGHWMLLGLALGAPVWLAWWWRMDAVARFDRAHTAPVAAPAPAAPDASGPPFDLASHLDSPAAQEGADKYTRE